MKSIKAEDVTWNESLYYMRVAQKVIHFFFSFAIYFMKISNMLHCYLNLWLPKPIFQHSLLLNLWPYATDMWEPVCLLGTTLQVSVTTISLLWKWLRHSLQTYFRRLHLSKYWKDGSQKEPDLGCKVDEAGQSTEALWWPLEYADLCVALHCHDEEARLSHLYGDEPSGNTSSEFPHRCPSWLFLIWLSALCIVVGVTAVDGRPECGRWDTLSCPCSDDASRFAQQLTVLLSAAVSPYSFIKFLWIFVIDSFSAKRSSITALCVEHTTLTDSSLKVHYFATI
jgi:hypothetical protein